MMASPSGRYERRRLPTGHHRPPLGVDLPPPRRKPTRETSRDGSVPWLDYGILLLMLVPNLVWIALDLSVWNAETAAAAQPALRLFHLLTTDRMGWVQGLVADLATTAPLLPWLGQLFVPLGEAIGSIDVGLLLVIVLAQIIAVWLLYEALARITNHRPAALVGCLLVVSAPLTIGVTRQFYPQPLQLLAVTWTLYVVARAPGWDIVMILLHLAAAGAFAMAVSLTSPAFILVPVLAALGHAWRNGTQGLKFGVRHVAVLGLAAALMAATGWWYAVNGAGAAEFGWAEYGTDRSTLAGVYPRQLRLWSTMLLGSLQASAAIGVLGLGIVLLIGAREPEARARRGVTIVAATQCLLILLALAISPRPAPRYLLPMVPYFAVLAACGLAGINRRWATAIIAVALVGQLGGVHAYTWTGPHREERATYLEVVNAMTQVTLQPQTRLVLTATGHFGVLAADAAFGAAKRPGFFARRPPEYESIESLVTGSRTDLDAVWDQIVTAGPSYVVTPSTGLRDELRGGTGADAAAAPRLPGTQVRTFDLADRISGSPLFEPVGAATSADIEIHRFVGGQ